MFGVGEVFRMLRNPARLSAVAGLALVLGTAAAAAFDYPSYQAADLDQLARRKPQLGLGADIPSVQSVRFDATLVEQADECPTKYLKWAMKKSGIAKDAIAGTPITRCITVKSAKGREYPLFIQDALAGPLAKALASRSIRRAALFGTRYVMESDFYGLIPGVEFVRPHPAELDAIHTIYVELAESHQPTPRAHAQLTAMAKMLCIRDRAEAVILAGTDLALLFNESNTEFPAIDCAALHIDAVVKAALSAPG